MDWLNTCFNFSIFTDAPLLENNTLQLNTETQDEVIEEENKES